MSQNFFLPPLVTQYHSRLCGETKLLISVAGLDVYAAFYWNSTAAHSGLKIDFHYYCYCLLQKKKYNLQFNSAFFCWIWFWLIFTFCMELLRKMR